MMAKYEKKSGKNPQAIALGRRTANGQTGEIAEMASLI